MIPHRFRPRLRLERSAAMGMAPRFVLGFIAGVCTGCAIAWAVAQWVQGIPAPQMRAVFRTAQDDALEAQRNADWDPNAPLRLRPLELKDLGPPTAAAMAGIALGSGVSQSVADVTAGMATAAPPLPIEPAPKRRPFVGLQVLETAPSADLDRVREQRRSLQASGLEARIVREQGEELYRLRLGPFVSEEELDRAQQQLRELSR